jgi:O-antigen/teichoic acid export membrane protein
MSESDASGSLDDATVSGVRWLAVMRVVSETIGLGAAVALARLISPADFGRAAVAMIFITIGVMLTFEGFASALVQRPEVDDADRQTAMLMSIVGGCVLAVIIYALATPVWRPLFGARTAALIQLVSPSVLIAALGGVSRATVWRRLDFRKVSMVDAISLFAGSVVAVGLAGAGMGARAIVIGGIVQTAVTTLMLVIAAPPPWPRWTGGSQRAIVGFGIPAALAALVDTLFRNVDYAILAARAPAATAGFYYRAFNVGVVYQDKLSRIMTQIAFPVYSRTADREQLRRMHERAARVHAAVIFPLLASLIALAPTLVPFVFGSPWRPAVVPTQILAGAGMVAAILTGYPQVMLAIGRPRSLLNFNMAMLLVYGTAVLLASRHGLVVVAVTVTAVYLVILVGVYRLLLQRHVGITLWRLIPELGPAIAGCVALLAVAVPLTHLLGPLPRIVNAAGAGSAGLAAYAMVLRVLFRPAWQDVVTLVVRVFPQITRIRRRAGAPSTPVTAH